MLSLPVSVNFGVCFINPAEFYSPLKQILVVKKPGVLVCCRTFYMIFADIDGADEGRWKEHFPPLTCETVLGAFSLSASAEVSARSRNGRGSAQPLPSLFSSVLKI